MLSAWRLLGVCKLALAASVCALHLSRCVTASRQWASYLRHPRDAFTDFYPLARQSQMYTVMSALLLFILVLKVRKEAQAEQRGASEREAASLSLSRPCRRCSQSIMNNFANLL